MGKQTRQPTKLAGRADPYKRAIDAGELIHSDIAGGGKITLTNGKKRYVHLLLDDATDFGEISLLRKKSEAYTKTRSFFIRMKNRGTPVQRFRGDNAGENGSDEMLKLYEEFGVQWEPTAPYNPNQNGVAERCFRTLFERTRSMLYDAQMPPSMWGEAIMTVMYLRNLSPTKSLRAMVPYEMFTSKKAYVGHLRVFGCIAYHHDEDPHLRKLDYKSNKCRLVGYEGHNKFRLWNGRRIITSANVQFDELVKITNLGEDENENQSPTEERFSEADYLSQIDDFDHLEEKIFPEQRFSDPVVSNENENNTESSSSDRESEPTNTHTNTESTGDESDEAPNPPRRVTRGNVRDYAALNDPLVSGQSPL